MIRLKRRKQHEQGGLAERKRNRENLNTEKQSNPQRMLQSS